MSSALIVVGDNLDVRPIEAAILRNGGAFYARVPDLAAASWLLASQGRGAIVVLPTKLFRARTEKWRWQKEHGAAALLATQNTWGLFFRLRLALALRSRGNIKPAETVLESLT